MRLSDTEPHFSNPSTFTHNYTIMKRILTLTLIISVLLSFARLSEAQNSEMRLTLENHEMMIDGTSNIRDWDAQVKTINSNFVINEFDMNDLSNLTADNFETLELSIPVEDVESGSGRLTRNMHKYLKGDDHPMITFNLTGIDSVTVNGNQATITANGIINAAGVDHQTSMTVDATFDNGTITFAGTQPLLMTDFNIDPPTAVFGTIRARDEIDIIYSLTFSM